MTVVNQTRNMKDCDSSKQEADHHAKNLPRTAWLMTILQAKNTTVGIFATCSRRGPDLKSSITAEITYYTHGSLITQNCQWKYLLRPTASKIAITHHHQLLLQETAWPLVHTVAATASWVSVDLDGFLERTASGDGFGRDSRRGGKSGWQTTACTMLAQDSR